MEMAQLYFGVLLSNQARRKGWLYVVVDTGSAAAGATLLSPTWPVCYDEYLFRWSLETETDFHL